MCVHFTLPMCGCWRTLYVAAPLTKVDIGACSYVAWTICTVRAMWSYSSHHASSIEWPQQLHLYQLPLYCMLAVPFLGVDCKEVTATHQCFHSCSRASLKLPMSTAQLLSALYFPSAQVCGAECCVYCSLLGLGAAEEFAWCVSLVVI